MIQFLTQHHLLGYLTDVARLSAWLVLLIVIFLPLERLFGLSPRKFLQRSVAVDVGYYFLNGLVPAILLTVPLALVAYGVHDTVPWRFQKAVAAWPLWERVAVGFVVGEFGAYWGHRWTHEVPFLWRFHCIHHSPKQLYFILSSRAHPFDNVFTRLCGLIPCYILGVASPLTPTGSLVPVLIVLIATMWGFFIHANLRWRLGPLEWLIATPAFHHWHHTQSDHRDHNYASMLPFVDRIFGTHYLPDHWPTDYGIDTPLPESMGGQLIYPF